MHKYLFFRAVDINKHIYRHQYMLGLNLPNKLIIFQVHNNLGKKVMKFFYI